MQPSFASCLYLGRVMHKRLRPFRHRFSYRVFSLLVDIDELPKLHRRLWLFSHNRWNVFSFQDRDHGLRDGTALRPWIDGELAKAGLDLAGGRVLLHSFPRLLGYVFNPLSVWFCYDRQDRLRAILYEVSNTFKQSHGYLFTLKEGANATEPLVHDCDKLFYVSPFIEMASRYRFRLRAPGERLSILIRQSVDEGEILIATHNGRRKALSDRSLLAAFFAYPLMTAKVIGAIHWQALWLWLKGATYQQRPAPPAVQVTRVITPRLKTAE